MPLPHKGRVLDLTLVCRNAETLIEAYLRRAGVATHNTRRIERLADMVPPSVSAVVIFADDFPFEAVRTAVTVVRSQRPAVLIVIVTEDPGAFATQPSSVLVLAKPVWGWTILDAIRAQLEPDLGRGGLVNRIGRLLSRRP